MSWKYINPGDYRLLYANSTAVNYVDTLLAPKTGVAFSNLSTVHYPIPVPDGIQEMWGVYTIFSGTITDGFTMSLSTREYNSSKVASIYFSSSMFQIYINGTSTSSRVYYQTYSKTNPKIFRVWFHVKSGASPNGLLEVYLNGTPLYSVANRAVIDGTAINIYTFGGANGSYYASDIIFSDEEIDLNEHCAVIPIRQTTAEGWSYDALANKYITDSIDKTIWQAPDVEQLKKELGLNNPKITGIVPQVYDYASTDKDVVDTLAKSIRSNETTLEIDRITPAGTRAISSAMTKNPITNADWTLKDLADIEFGITTAKS